MGMYEDFYGGMFGDYSSTNQLMSEIGPASNVNAGSNPSYALTDFLTDFSQFTSVCTAAAPATPTIPTTLSQAFINVANTSLSYGKYGELWRLCMGLYVAHLCAMFLYSASGGTTAQDIIGHSKPILLQTSKSVGDVSASYDTGSIADDLKGFGSLKMTTYGQQLATFAKMAGMGGAFVR